MVQKITFLPKQAHLKSWQLLDSCDLCLTSLAHVLDSVKNIMFVIYATIVIINNTMIVRVLVQACVDAACLTQLVPHILSLLARMFKAYYHSHHYCYQ